MKEYTLSCFKIIFNLYREQERKCGPDGFLDSTKYTHSFTLKREKDKSPRLSTETPRTVVDLSQSATLDQKDYEKRIRLIEVRF